MIMEAENPTSAISKLKTQQSQWCPSSPSLEVRSADGVSVHPKAEDRRPSSFSKLE